MKPSLIPLLAVLPQITTAAAPTVQLDYATFRGFSAAATSSDNFLGIPFAKAGRLENPSVLSARDKLNGIQDATQYGPSCVQQALTAAPLDQGNAEIGRLLTIAENIAYPNITRTSEDCLSINVQIPHGTRAGAKLPVLMWIHGGGFEVGGSAALGFEQTGLPGVIYQGANLVLRSVQMGKPVVFVSANYRLNGFGTLASEEITRAGLSNLGLKDQVEAMKWVQKYISRFGGDPNKVTIWGESAGAMSIGTHLVRNDGHTNNLFHAAIMMSGGPGKFLDYRRAQPTFDSIIAQLNCTHASDKIACFRAAPFADINKAINSFPNFFSYNSTSVPWYPRPDGTFLKDSPHRLLRTTGVADVPILISDMRDEGTLFSLVNQLFITTDAQFRAYYASVFFPAATAAQIAALTSLYPQNPSAGSPFGTGARNALTPQYKRLAALTGDYTFQAPRRDLLNLFADKRRIWSCMIEDSQPLLGQIPALAGTGIADVPALGSFHVSEVTLYTFGLVPPSLSKNSLNLMSMLVSFANTHDPNYHGLDLPYWPRYNTRNRTLFRYKEDGPDLIKDDYRQNAFEYINNNGDAFRT